MHPSPQVSVLTLRPRAVSPVLQPVERELDTLAQWPDLTHKP